MFGLGAAYDASLRRLAQQALPYAFEYDAACQIQNGAGGEDLRLICRVAGRELLFAPADAESLLKIPLHSLVKDPEAPEHQTIWEFLQQGKGAWLGKTWHWAGWARPQALTWHELDWFPCLRLVLQLPLPDCIDFMATVQHLYHAVMQDLSAQLVQLLQINEAQDLALKLQNESFLAQFRPFPPSDSPFVE